jgi:hypothetical protein
MSYRSEIARHVKACFEAPAMVQALDACGFGWHPRRARDLLARDAGEWDELDLRFMLGMLHWAVPKSFGRWFTTAECDEQGRRTDSFQTPEERKALVVDPDIPVPKPRQRSYAAAAKC